MGKRKAFPSLDLPCGACCLAVLLFHALCSSSVRSWEHKIAVSSAILYIALKQTNSKTVIHIACQQDTYPSSKHCCYFCTAYRKAAVAASAWSWGVKDTWKIFSHTLRQDHGKGNCLFFAAECIKPTQWFPQAEAVLAI